MGTSQSSFDPHKLQQGRFRHTYLVRLRLRWWELDAHTAAVVHNGLDELSTGSNHGVVNLAWNRDIRAHHVGHLGLDLLYFLDLTKLCELLLEL